MGLSTTPLHGKAALVTGGSSGIGAATARQLAMAGAALAIGYHSGRERAEALLQELEGTGHLAVPLALEDPDTIRAAETTIRQHFGRLDVLVNSAGFTRRIPHHDLKALDEALFETILLANTLGPYSVIRNMLPLLRKSDDAVVVNVSSISAFTGSGSNIAYCAAKAALDTMTQSFARVFGPNVRFLSVAPGVVGTGFVPGQDRSAIEARAARTPLQRVVEPDDVAQAILACAISLKTATGSRIVIDGGQSLS